jgi:hypothetical protein
MASKRSVSVRREEQEQMHGVGHEQERSTSTGRYKEPGKSFFCTNLVSPATHAFPFTDPVTAQCHRGCRMELPSLPAHITLPFFLRMVSGICPGPGNITLDYWDRAFRIGNAFSHFVTLLDLETQ